jgi:hypothetical protein
MNVLGHFSVSWKYTEALNEIFDFMESSGAAFLDMMPALGKMLRC